MGNSGSSRSHQHQQLEAAAARHLQHQQSQQSKFHQHKVLLDLDTTPRLRPTQNGAILHQGGTISQRHKLQRDLYGSEPDLRFSGSNNSSNQREDSHASKLRISRNQRKKYRAPPAPHYEQRDFFHDWEGEKPSRRLRLFLTRAEASKKKTSTQEHVNAEVHVESRPPLPPPGGRLRRSLSTPQFQQNQELGRHFEEDDPPSPRVPQDVGRPPRVPPVHQPEPEIISNGFLEELREKQMMRENRFKRNESRLSRQSGRSETKKEVVDSTQRQRDEETQWLASTKSPVPVKTFYFGMDEPVDDPFGFDTFSPKVQTQSFSSSESQLSGSEGFLDGEDSGEGISVHLRATLPRKQVDIPRFSPAAAWRLLSGATETSVPSPLPPQEDEVVESRILAPPPIQIPALIPDKSADSGISGDASPQQFDSAAWTPQQDLEETSSDGFPNDFLHDLRYTPRLSLSLPKEGGVDAEKPSYAFDKPPFPFVKPFPDLDNNWMLSCSIPSSVNYPPAAEDDPPASLVKKPSFSYLTAGGHIMYLPEYSHPDSGILSSQDSRTLSKSCEDLSEPPALNHQQNHSLNSTNNNNKNNISNNNNDSNVKYKQKKFTFQSTIRQQERKEIADKLSRIAEYTELKRRSEQEVMRRVEEEFQRKREREKADIRQQLRLFNITNRAQLASLESSASNP